MKKLISIALVFIAVAAHGLAQIAPGKAIQIMIQGVPTEEKSRIDGMYPVSENGSVNMPFIGHVQAAGLRSEQLASNIQGRYRSAGIYTNPTIQVISDTEKGNVNEAMVHVGGQVRRPGPVKYTSGLTLYQAVQSAGGATEFGSMRRVKVYRGGTQKQYDLSQAQFMRIELAPDDTIEIPQKDFLGR